MVMTGYVAFRLVFFFILCCCPLLPTPPETRARGNDALMVVEIRHNTNTHTQSVAPSFPFFLSLSRIMFAHMGEKNRISGCNE